MPTIDQIATLSAARVDGAVAYVWKFRMSGEDFDYDTLVSGQPASGSVSVAKRLDRSGTLGWSCQAVDALGQVSNTQSGTLSVTALPTIELASVTLNDKLFPYTTVITVTVSTGTVTWSPTPSSGQGTTAATYTVTEDMAVTATVSSAGGTATLPIEIRGRASRAPLLVVSASPSRMRAGGGSVTFTAIAVDPDDQAVTIAWSSWPGGTTPGTPSVDDVGASGNGKRSRVVLPIPLGTTIGLHAPVATATTTADGKTTSANAPIEVLGNYVPTILGVVTSGLVDWNSSLTRTLETRKVWPAASVGIVPERPCSDFDSSISSSSISPYKWYPNCPEFLAVVYDRDNDDQPIAPYGASIYQLAPGQTTYMPSGWVEVLVRVRLLTSAPAPTALPTNAPIILRLNSTVGGLSAGDYRGTTVGPFSSAVDGLTSYTIYTLQVWVQSGSAIASGVADNPAAELWLAAAARPLSYSWTATYSWDGESFTAWPVFKATSPTAYIPLAARRTQQVTSSTIGSAGDHNGSIKGTVGAGAAVMPIAACTISYRQTVGAGFGASTLAYQPDSGSVSGGASFPASSGVVAFELPLRTGLLPDDSSSYTGGVRYTNTSDYAPLVSNGKAQLTFSYLQPRGNRVAIVLSVTDPLGNTITTASAPLTPGGLSTMAVDWESVG